MKTKALTVITSKTVTKFLWKNVILRHDCFCKLIIDEGSENKNVVAELTVKYKIKQIVISAYHSQTNKIIKQKHKLIVNVLSKMTEEDSEKDWIKHLSAVLWMNWMTVKVSINQLSYYLLYRARFILLIELEISSWQMLSWSEVEFTDDLLAVHVRQCECCNRNLKEAACHLQCIREENKDLFNENHCIHEFLMKNMLILLYDTKLDVNMFIKLMFKWLESY